jgi:hypothetical protein
VLFVVNCASSPGFFFGGGGGIKANKHEVGDSTGVYLKTSVSGTSPPPHLTTSS